MTCREVIDFLMAYLDGELPAPTRERFERHLSMCPACVRFLESYRTTVEMGKLAMREENGVNPPPEDLVKAILAARPKGS